MAPSGRAPAFAFGSNSSLNQDFRTSFTFSSPPPTLPQTAPEEREEDWGTDSDYGGPAPRESHQVVRPLKSDQKTGRFAQRQEVDESQEENLESEQKMAKKKQQQQQQQQQQQKQSSPSLAVDSWVRQIFLREYCNTNGAHVKRVNFDALRNILIKQRPKDSDAISKTLKELDVETVTEICNRFPTDKSGKFLNSSSISQKLMQLRPEKNEQMAKAIIKKVEADNVAKLKSQPVRPIPVVKSKGTDEALEAWIYSQYLTYGFTPTEFKGFATLLRNMSMIRPERKDDILVAVQKLQQPGHKYSFGDPQAILQAKIVQKQRIDIKNKNQKGGVQIQPSTPKDSSSEKDANLKQLFPGAFPKTFSSETAAGATFSAQTPSIPANKVNLQLNDLLARKMNQLQISSGSNSETEGYSDDDDESVPEETEDSDIESIAGTRDYPFGPDYEQIDLLMPDELVGDDVDGSNGQNAEIQHAPLINGSMIKGGYMELLPQYGFFGVHDKMKMFLNTNIPFSAFICGVQGSGKSHTTSCILENALIPSRSLGHLKNPLSALVFSYGHFSGGGEGFNVSEAAFLAAPHRDFPKQPSVKKVTVMVSPSNFHDISKLYNRIPKVTVLPMKLKPHRLDIDTMLTLMAVDQSEEPPLYLVQVTPLLRGWAEEGRGFDYVLFKQRLKACKFNRAQSDMLNMRLDQLESFLDLDNSYREPDFKPGEITIIDMSCPFMDANTACIMFRLGLQRYLQSSASGKMIVLDEAHKYMLNNPGAKALNEQLLQVIRLQRHYGARVVVSTQEPTLLTDLIALCSVTVIHRFSSPEWFSALKRHIPMSNQDHSRLLQDIESLKTGTALVYASNAVLGKDECGNLIKGSGKMMKVSVRKRITSDGGQSVLAAGSGH